MNVTDFENAVWEIEGVRITIRAPANTAVGDYDYKKAYNGNNNVNEWLDGRVRSRLENLDFVVVSGRGEHAHRGQKMDTLRDSYSGD